MDHCTFHKAYDGVLDVKKGSNGVTVSWSSFIPDDLSSNSWVTQQINALEANMSAYPMYNYLRSSAIGLSKADIIAIAAGQKKGHLVGATEFASDNADLEVTLHHNYYKDMQDRMPRLRGGNAHIYNVVMDNASRMGCQKENNTCDGNSFVWKRVSFWRDEQWCHFNRGRRGTRGELSNYRCV